MRYWIDIEDRNGNKYGDGPIYTALYWEDTDPLDKAGTFTFAMPAGDPRRAIVKEKRIARCYTLVMGMPTELGAGIIDKITPRIDVVGNVTLEVSGDSLLRELANRSVGFLSLCDEEGNGVTDGIGQIMNCAPAGWSVDGSVGTREPAGTVYASFAGESALNALVKVANQKGEHFRLQSGRKIAWLGPATGSVSSGIRAIQDGDPIAIDANPNACIVQELTEEQDTYDICTRIYPFGSGIGDARLTLAACTRPVPAGFSLDKAANCLINNAAETKYGRIDKYLSFKDVSPISNTDADLESAANVLFDQASIYLTRHSTAEKFYTIKVLKLDKLVRPGQTIRVVFRRIIDNFEAYNIDRDLFILEAKNRIDNTGIRTTEIQVSTVDRYPENEQSFTVSQMDTGQSMESHPQLNANAYVVSYRESMDNSKPAVIDFWLGREVLNVIQVALRFRIDPLRSTVKSVAGNTTTSSSGGGGTQTSSGGGSSTVSSGSSLLQHQHFVPSAPPSWSYMNSQFHNHSVSVPSHSHSVDIPEHSHNVTPSINTQYGVYEASSAETLLEAHLVYQVNGGDAIGRAVDIGGGWYEIDITDLVSNGLNRRPLREANQLRISTAVGRMATITGQLVVRTTIQAIAVY